MILTIMRHGQAGRAASDRQRQITAVGNRDVRSGAVRLARLCAVRALPDPDWLLFSDWVRTRQTAERVGQVLSVNRVDSLDALLPGAVPAAVDAALPAYWERSEHLLLVSHQPLVSRLVDHYTGEPGRAPGVPPGGFVTLNLAAQGPGCGRLLFWAFPPDYEAGA